MPLSILITRPRPAADQFARDLRAAVGPGVPVLVSPVMRIETETGAAPDLSGVRTLILTSAHAGPLDTVAMRPDVTCYCVGAATAAAARAKGVRAIEAGGTVERLLERLADDAPPGPIHYLRGAHVSADLAGILAQAGLDVTQTIVYRQVEVPLDAGARDLLGGSAPVILPLFSARSARLVFSVGPVRAPLLVAAISDSVAREVPFGRAGRLVIADAPTTGSMIMAIEVLASGAKPVESDGRAT